jgi:hypothetical protein
VTYEAQFTCDDRCEAQGARSSFPAEISSKEGSQVYQAQSCYHGLALKRS